IGDPSSRLGDTNRGLESRRKSEGLYGSVDSLAIGQLEYLLDRVASARINDDVGAESECQLLALGDPLNGNDEASASQATTDGRAEADRSLSEDRDGVPKPQLGVLSAGETRRHHVAHVHGLFVKYAVGYPRQVGFGRRHHEVLRHVAVDLH